MNRDAQQVLTELLVLKAQGGNEGAFAELYSLWAPHLHRLASVQVGDAGAADEVVQDAWVAIARGIRRLDDPACFPRWAFRILGRRGSDWIRRRQTERRHIAELAAAQVSGDTAPGPRPEPDDVVALREAIIRLEPESRELLHLFYELDLSVAEIADVLDVPAGTVKSRLYNLREKLRQQMERKRS